MAKETNRDKGLKLIDDFAKADIPGLTLTRRQAAKLALIAVRFAQKMLKEEMDLSQIRSVVYNN